MPGFLSIVEYRILCDNRNYIYDIILRFFEYIKRMPLSILRRCLSDKRCIHNYIDKFIKKIETRELFENYCKLNIINKRYLLLLICYLYEYLQDSETN